MTDPIQKVRADFQQALNDIRSLRLKSELATAALKAMLCGGVTLVRVSEFEESETGAVIEVQYCSAYLDDPERAMLILTTRDLATGQRDVAVYPLEPLITAMALGEPPSAFLTAEVVDQMVGLRDQAQPPASGDAR